MNTPQGAQVYNNATGTWSEYRAPTAPSAIPVDALTSTQTPINVPQQPTPDTHVGTNLSVPSPAAIISQESTPTAGEAQQTDLQTKIAQLMQGKSSLATEQTTAESSVGVPGLAKTVNDLSTQLQGLNDQATKLQLDASAGGTIDNQVQNNAEGRGITAGGLAPIQAAELRKNQIQQASLAGQSLTLKSALYAAQGQYSLAKDAADKAAQVKFDAVEQDLNYQKSLLEAIQPQVTREQKARADLVQAQLADRVLALQNSKEDFKTGQGLAITTLKNFPNNPQAQYAAQEAMKLDPSDPQYLQKVMDLVGKYQANPQDLQNAILDQQYKRAQINLANINAAKINQDMKLAQPVIPTQTNAPYINAFNNAIAGIGADTAKVANRTFSNILATGDTNQARTYIVRTALQHAPADQQNQAIGRSQALTAMSDIQSLLQQAAAKGANTNLLTGTITDVANKLGTTNNPDMNYIRSRILQSLITYRKAMTGVAFGPQEASDYAKIFPDITNVETLNTSKIQALTDSLNSNNRATVGYLIGDQNYDALFPIQSTNTLPSNQSATTNNDAFIKQAKAAGYSDADIQAFLKGK